VFGKLNPIIVTLGTNFAGAAIVNIYLTSGQTPLKSGLAKWGQSEFLGLPSVFWAMAIFVLIAGYFLSHSRAGRRIIAVGGNPQAARVRGISLRRARFGVFMVSGAVCGFAAVLFTASTLNFVSSEATYYLLPCVAATILAGIRLQGGSGNLWTILLSVGLLSTVTTSLAFFGVGELWQNVPPGAVLVIAVSIDGYRQLRSKR
jgi:ribose transport system permease protein